MRLAQRVNPFARGLRVTRGPLRGRAEPWVGAGGYAGGLGGKPRDGYRRTDGSSAVARTHRTPAIDPLPLRDLPTDLLQYAALPLLQISADGPDLLAAGFLDTSINSIMFGLGGLAIYLLTKPLTNAMWRRFLIRTLARRLDAVGAQDAGSALRTAVHGIPIRAPAVRTKADAVVRTHAAALFRTRPTTRWLGRYIWAATTTTKTRLKLLHQAMQSGIVKTAADFVRLTKPPSFATTAAFDTALDGFIRGHIETFFALHPSVAQIKVLEDRNISTDLDLVIAMWDRAIADGLVRSAADFVRLVRYTMPIPSDDYRNRVAAFVDRHRARFLALLPSLDDIRAVTLQLGQHPASAAPLLQWALEGGRVRRARDFVRLVGAHETRLHRAVTSGIAMVQVATATLGPENDPTAEYLADRYVARLRRPTPEYLAMLDEFLRTHLDALFALRPSLQHIRAIALHATHGVEIVIALSERAMAAGLVRTPNGFLQLMQYTTETPSAAYLDAMGKFLLRHLDTVVAMRPRRDALRRIAGRHPEFPETAWLLDQLSLLPTPQFATDGKPIPASLVAEFRDWRSAMHAFTAALGPRILRDEIDAGDLSMYGQAPRVRILLAAIRRATLVSAKSWFSDTPEAIAYLADLIRAGDRRGDLPAAWRTPKAVARFELPVGEWQRTASAGPADPAVTLLHETLRSTTTSTQQAVTHAIGEYLASPRDADARDRLVHICLAHAASQRGVRSCINLIDPATHEGIDVLQGLLILETTAEAHEGAVVRSIREAFQKVPVEQLRVAATAAHGTQQIFRPHQLLERIRAVWALGTADETRRLAIIARIVRDFASIEIETKLLPAAASEPALQAAIAQALTTTTISATAFLRELFAPTHAQLQAARAQFTYREVGMRRFAVRPVKGIPHGMFGLSTGVCIYDDLEAWTNPQFRLLAIIDEDAEQIVGYIQTVESTVDGERLLHLVGINPAAEQLQHVSAQAFFDHLMASTIQLADMAGFDGVTIPVDPYINSNRAPFQKIIEHNAAAGAYTPLQIPTVHWTFSENDFPFTHVWRIWRRPCAGTESAHSRSV